MSLRERVARWLSPEPVALLERYRRAVDPGLLDLFERVSADGMFERASPVETTPVGLGMLGFSAKAIQDLDLTRGSLSNADLAVRAIANRVSELKPVVKVRRRVRMGTVVDEVLDDHIAQTRLEYPHPSFTLSQLLSVSTKQLLQSGEANWLKIRDGFGLPSAFQPLTPGMSRPLISRGVVTGYVLLGSNGERREVAYRDVIRFFLPDPSTLYDSRGYLSPNWGNHRASVFSEKHLEKFFENDATPSVYIQGREGATAPGDAARRAFEALWIQTHHRRLGPTRPPAFIPPGWEAKESTLQKGQELVPLLEFWMRQQLMNYGVPRSVLGEVVSGDRSSAETNQYVFDRHTVGPVARVFAEGLTYGFVREFDERLFVGFEEFIAKDKDFDLRQEESDIRMKVRSPQQILRDRGGDPEDAPWGEFPPGSIAEGPYTGEVQDTAQGGIGPELSDAGGAAQPKNEGDQQQGEDTAAGPPRSRRDFARLQLPEVAWQRAAKRRKRWISLARSAARRVFTVQERAAVSALSRARGMRVDIEAVLAAVSDLPWEVHFEPIRRRAFRSSGEEAIASVSDGRSFQMTPAVTERIKRYGAAMVRNVNSTTKHKLRAELTDAAMQGEGTSQIVKRVEGVFDVRRTQATFIARTEMLRATEDAQIEGFRQSGVVEKKRWNDSQDDRVRESHVEGEIAVVGLEESFTLANGRLADYPGDPNLPAEDVVNCRCFVTAELT